MNVIEKNKQVIVSMKGSGYGIDRGMISRLFTKFATKSFDGTGLGLYISGEDIIEETHGGMIWAEDNDDGTKGATFSFLVYPNCHHTTSGSKMDMFCFNWFQELITIVMIEAVFGKEDNTIEVCSGMIRKCRYTSCYTVDIKPGKLILTWLMMLKSCLLYRTTD